MSSGSVFTMWMLILMACSEPDPEIPTDAPSPVRAIVSVKERPRGSTSGREPITEALSVSGWGGPVADCTGRCVPLKTREQASSVQTLDNQVYEAVFAADGDLFTAWCGEGAVGQKLALRMEGPRTLRQIRLAGWTGEGAALAEIDLVTDKGDRIPVSFEAPNGKWPGLGDQPPTINVVLEGVQFLQVEVRGVHGVGPACISEVMLLGE